MEDIKFHWMQNDINLSTDILKSLSKELDEANYYSVLLPFHSRISDSWIKSAHILDKTQKIKYMVAFRPYHISPQYFAMLVSGFNDIQQNRLMINFIAGDGRKDEPDQMDVYGETANLLDIEKRKEYVRKFLTICKDLDIVKNIMPEAVISGLSDYSIKTAEIFDATILCMYDDYLNNIDRLKNCKRKMVSVKICIRDTDEEAEKIISLSKNSREKLYTIYGTEISVENRIKEIVKGGVTDFLIGGYKFDRQLFKIHNFIKKITTKYT